MVLFYPLPNAKYDFSQISSGVTNLHESIGKNKGLKYLSPPFCGKQGLSDIS